MNARSIKKSRPGLHPGGFVWEATYPESGRFAVNRYRDVNHHIGM